MWAAVAVLRSVRDEQESDSDGDELESDSGRKIMMEPGGWVMSLSLICHGSDFRIEQLFSNSNFYPDSAVKTFS